MKIYDISQELLGCKVYPGDRVPELYSVKRIERGDAYNLSELSMCVHNGTHIDSPFHFMENGATVEKIPLSNTVGFCFVAEHHGVLCRLDALKIIRQAGELCSDAAKRILIKGDALVTEEAARAFTDACIYLLGVESQSVGDPEKPMAVHKILLGRDTVLLEGLRLSEVPVGVYILSAAPISIMGADGAPARAVLIDLEK